jgi:hypothetical protein
VLSQTCPATSRTRNCSDATNSPPLVNLSMEYGHVSWPLEIPLATGGDERVLREVGRTVQLNGLAHANLTAGELDRLPQHDAVGSDTGVHVLLSVAFAQALASEMAIAVSIARLPHDRAPAQALRLPRIGRCAERRLREQPRLREHRQRGEGVRDLVGEGHGEPPVHDAPLEQAPTRRQTLTVLETEPVRSFHLQDVRLGGAPHPLINAHPVDHAVDDAIRRRRSHRRSLRVLLTLADEEKEDREAQAARGDENAEDGTDVPAWMSISRGHSVHSSATPSADRAML